MKLAHPSRTLTLWLVVAMIGGLGALPLWQDGFLNKRIIGETPYLLMRVQQLYTSLNAGVFPVRWMPDGAYGLGYPFYNYYAALPFYIAAGLRLAGIGTVLSIKLVQTLSFVLGALGMYAWSRRHFRHDSAAIAAAALFTFAPMHLINIYTRGDSLSEFWAMSMYPWLLWAFDHPPPPPRPLSAAWLALAAGTLMLSHNISALIFSPIAGLYAVWMMLPRWKAKRQWLTLVGSGLLGLALSAWFWIPALLDQSSLRMENMLAGFFDFHSSFLDKTPIQTGWLIDYEAYPYRPGLWQAIVAMAGIAAIAVLLVRYRKGTNMASYRRVAMWVVVALIISVGMTFSVSTWAYEHLPLLKYLQFPWRWLSVVALVGAAAGGYVLDMIRQYRLRIAGLIAVVLLTVSTALPSLHLNFFPLSEEQITPERLNEAEFYSGDIGTTVRTDYLPFAAYPRPLTGPAILQEYPLKVIDGVASGSLVRRDVNRQVWEVTVSSPQAMIAIPTLYWPGWQSYLEDGTQLPTSAVDGIGWIQTQVLNGDHVMTVRLQETPQHWFFDAISALALLLWLALVVRPVWRWLTVRRNQRFAIGSMIAVALMLLILRVVSAASTPEGPQASQFFSVSYRHSFPGGIPFKDAGRLLDYNYPTEVNTGEPVDISLTWDQPTSAYIEIIPAPVNFWNYKAALATGQGSNKVTINIPAEAAPGLYFVHISAGSDVYDLQPLRILTGVTPASNSSQQTDFGGVLRLLGVNVQSLDRGRLNAYMHWQALKPITRNYGLSVRLRNPAGVQIASHDAALGVYGTVPPAYWPTLFTDWLSLPDLEGLPPGIGYQMTITIFDNDRAIGSAEIRDIVVRTSPAQSQTINATAFTGKVEAQSSSVEQGARLLLNCDWEGQVQADWNVRWTLHSAGADWRTITPLAPGARLEWWQPTQHYRAIVPLQIPIDLKADTYTLQWDVINGDGQIVGPSGTAGNVQITPTSRMFVAPAMANTANVTFGQVIQLAGYEAAQREDQLELQLLWKASAAMDTSYTYFVHVQRKDAPTPAAQIDSMPHNNQYPTANWLPGESVLDKASVSLSGLAGGTYDIWLGWYNPQNGARLPVPGSEDGRYHLTTISIP